LQIAHNGLNEVIVVSEILERYIREKFPKYPVVSSTCKHIEDPEKLRSELNKDYKMVVLDYNLNNKFEMYNTFSQEEKSKCEFLCFEVCIPNCPKRHEHQINTGQNIINLVKHLETGCGFEPIPFECMNGVLHTIYDIQDYPTFISPEAIYQKYVPMGFRNFKLESRTTDTLVLLDFYCQYLVKPEYRDKTRIDMLMHLKRNGVYKLES
jgi:collagenase-like PrtC family protease